MRKAGLLIAMLALAAGVASAQQANSPSPPAQAEAQPVQVKVYAAGEGVTLPEFIPLNLAPTPPEKCKEKQDGKVLLSLFVDTAGHPRNIMFLRPLGSELDRFALRIASADRFKPGMVDGKPVVVAGSLEVGIQSCILESTDNAGKENYSLRLRSVPVQRFEALQQPPEETTLTTEAASWKTSGNVYKVGGGVSDPAVLNRVETEFTDAARSAQYQGQCLLTAIVDEQGMPEDLEVLKPLDYGLTENAVAAVSKYRFRPAMKDGKPVAVKITIEVNFKRTEGPS